MNVEISDLYYASNMFEVHKIILSFLIENEKSSGDEGIMKANERGEMGAVVVSLILDVLVFPF